MLIQRIYTSYILNLDHFQPLRTARTSKTPRETDRKSEREKQPTMWRVSDQSRASSGLEVPAAWKRSVSDGYFLPRRQLPPLIMRRRRRLRGVFRQIMRVALPPLPRGLVGGAIISSVPLLTKLGIAWSLFFVCCSFVSRKYLPDTRAHPALLHRSLTGCPSSTAVAKVVILTAVSSRLSPSAKTNQLADGYPRDTSESPNWFTMLSVWSVLLNLRKLN